MPEETAHNMSTVGRGFAELDEARLVPRIRSGDAAAYRQLFEVAYPALFQFAAHVIGSRDAAEDAVQTVLLDVWVNRERLSPDGSLQAYLYRAVRNHLLNVLRHADVVAKAELSADAEAPYGMGTAPAPADAQMESSDLVELVAAAVRGLRERQRTAVILRWYEGMTTAAVADVMGISRQVAEKLLGKAEAKLRTILRDSRL